MKKIIITFVFAIIATASTFAAKSTGTPFTFKQADGTTITVRLLGDEHVHWYQTTDNVLLVKENNSFYVAKTNEDGSLTSTGCLAHNAAQRSFKEANLVQMQDRKNFCVKADEKLSNIRKVISGYPLSYFCPHSGNVRIPIILMNYTDTTFVFDKSDFEEYFNGTTKTTYSKATKFNGYSSVRQYFTDASDGKFTPQFDLYGPYTADHNHNYYGKKSGRELSLLTEAVKKADADIDFTQYDSNNDGNVDMVYILYAGTGANISKDDNDFWPACWYSFFGSYATADNMNIKIIGGANELATSKGKNPSYGNLRAGIGVCCHEMSHGLGLPDLYWTLSSVPEDEDGWVDYNNCGPEDWDLMDGGENLYNGMWPCQYTAWERDVMGWLDVEDLEVPHTVTVYPLNDPQGRGKAFRVTNPDNPKEYYIIENYQPDEWNYYVNARYGSGLMIYHLNSGTYGFDMSPNTTYGKPNITILPADGLILAIYSEGETFPYNGEIMTMPEGSEFTKNYFIPEAKGDPYPGSQNITSVASYKNYTGEDMVYEFPITNIQKNDDGSITFKFMKPTGDVNGDYVVDISDVNAIIDVICGGTTNPEADVNEDGNIDISDVNEVISIICGD